MTFLSSSLSVSSDSNLYISVPLVLHLCTYIVSPSLTHIQPLDPALFFFLAVDALSAFERLLAFEAGRQRSGFFLSLDVPHLPLMLPSVPIRTQF